MTLGKGYVAKEIEHCEEMARAAENRADRQRGIVRRRLLVNAADLWRRARVLRSLMQSPSPLSLPNEALREMLALEKGER